MFQHGVPRETRQEVIGGIETVTRDTTRDSRKFLKSCQLIKNIRFQVQIIVLAERSNRKSLPDVCSVSIIALGYSVACDSRDGKHVSSFRRSQHIRTEKNKGLPLRVKRSKSSALSVCKSLTM